MTFLRSAKWFMLALIVGGAIAQQQANAQIPVGTTRTGTFIWDGVPLNKLRLLPKPVFRLVWVEWNCQSTTRRRRCRSMCSHPAHNQI